MIRLAEFLGLSLTEEQAKQLVEFCSMKNMSESPAFGYLKSSSVFDPDFSFFRKAQVGNWREYFNAELSDRVDCALSQNLNFKGVFDYGV